MSMGVSYPASFRVWRALVNSSAVQGSSIVGMRMPFSVSTDSRAKIDSAASQ